MSRVKTGSSSAAPSGSPEDVSSCKSRWELRNGGGTVVATRAKGMKTRPYSERCACAALTANPRSCHGSALRRLLPVSDHKRSFDPRGSHKAIFERFPKNPLPWTQMKSKIAPFVENIAESTTACLVTMVQGNLLAVSVTHWLIAARVGVIAGSVATMVILVLRTQKPWLVSSTLGGITVIVDLLVHPGNFGPILAEPLVTGFGAAALSFLVGKTVSRLRRRA